MVANKVGELGHDFFAGWYRFQHLVGNTGVLLDKGTDAKPRVHKLLEAVFDLTLLDQHRANFNSPVPMGGRQAGGFEVEHHDGVGGWLWKILVHGVHHSRSREIATMGFPGPGPD